MNSNALSTTLNPLETTQQRTKNPSELNNNTLQTAHNTPLTA